MSIPTIKWWSELRISVRNCRYDCKRSASVRITSSFSMSYTNVFTIHSTQGCMQSCLMRLNSLDNYYITLYSKRNNGFRGAHKLDSKACPYGPPRKSTILKYTGKHPEWRATPGYLRESVCAALRRGACTPLFSRRADTGSGQSSHTSYHAKVQELPGIL